MCDQSTCTFDSSSGYEFCTDPTCADQGAIIYTPPGDGTGATGAGSNPGGIYGCDVLCEPQPNLAAFTACYASCLSGGQPGTPTDPTKPGPLLPLPSVNLLVWLGIGAGFLVLLAR